MSSMESACNNIASILIGHCQKAEWDFIELKTKILKDGLSRLTLNSICFQQEFYIDAGRDIFEISENILFIRKYILETTGQRIWGLTFTLEPAGKFKIDYDYTKPEGYEETDEVITGDEINQSLRDLTQKKDDPASS